MQPGHKGVDCFQSPSSANYKPTGRSKGGGEPAKKRKFESNYKDNSKFQKWKEEKNEYQAFMTETEEAGYDEE